MVRQREQRPTTIYSSLRITPDLRAQLQAMAKREHRSLHGQIIYVLEQAVKSQASVPPLNAEINRVVRNLRPEDGWVSVTPDAEPVNEGEFAAALIRGVV